MKLNAKDLQESYDRSLAEEKERDQKREELVRKLQNIAELAKASKDTQETFRSCTSSDSKASINFIFQAKKEAETAEYKLQVAIQTLADELVPRS
jgi:F0F1-type ATP synthase delta subunit